MSKMPKYAYFLNLPGLCLKVETPEPVFAQEKARMLAAAYLPGLSFGEESAVNLTICFEESQTPGLEVKERVIILSDAWAGEGSLLDLIHLTYSAALKLWLAQGLYCVHSACLAKAPDFKEATLILGHSGCGKTTLALALAAKGNKIYSANKTLIAISPEGKMLALAGTPTITRKQEVESAIAVGSEAALDYVGRRAYALASDAYSREQAITITAIALARLNDGVAEREELSSLSALHRLFPFFLDKVNADTVLLGGKTVFSGDLPLEEDRQVKTKLALALSKSLPSLSVTTLAGSLDYVSLNL
jgi:energy-coupling factor transporter ATP-binding protein EcfA2